MSFTTLSYYLFLPSIFLVFYLTSSGKRWLVLLVASYGFYASQKELYLIAMLFLVTCISYYCGLRIEAQKEEKLRKQWFWFGCIICISILSISKFLPTLTIQTDILTDQNHNLTKSFVIIGVSYFTFQAISYLADIYLELISPEKHFGYYALHLSFFPKLLQGPIERADDLLPQLKKPYEFDYDAMRSGMLLFASGLFKKVVIADRFALYADQVYNHVQDYSGSALFIGTYAFALQIFFDFSGYTDMARGTARLFGINLTENFNNPYGATSIADFWRRWHISFSRWILDYIFKPLQIQWREKKNHGIAAALLVTFVLSGIWHGAGWGFVIWGSLHGIYMACSVYYRPVQKRLHSAMGLKKTTLLKFWQTAVVFNLVSFAWIFFRANNLSDAIYIVNNLLFATQGNSLKLLLSQGSPHLIILSVAVITFAFSVYVINFTSIINRLLELTILRHLVYCLMVIIILVFGVYEIRPEFLYSNF